MGEQSRYGVLFRGASTLVGKQMKIPQLEYNSGKIPLSVFTPFHLLLWLPSLPSFLSLHPTNPRSLEVKFLNLWGNGIMHPLI